VRISGSPRRRPFPHSSRAFEYLHGAADGPLNISEPSRSIPCPCLCRAVRGAGRTTIRPTHLRRGPVSVVRGGYGTDPIETASRGLDGGRSDAPTWRTMWLGYRSTVMYWDTGREQVPMPRMTLRFALPEAGSGSAFGVDTDGHMCGTTRRIGVGPYELDRLAVEPV